MACEGGYIGGAGCLRHDRKGSAELDHFAGASEYKTISEALKK